MRSWVIWSGTRSGKWIANGGEMKPRRLERIDELIKEEVSKIILYELKNPNIEMVTVTKVETTNDLRYANVFFSVYAEEDRKAVIIEQLENARKTVRHLLGRVIRLRYTPEIVFKYDSSIEHSAKIAKILNDLKKEQKGE